MKRFFCLLMALSAVFVVSCKKEADMGNLLISVNQGPLEVTVGESVKSTFYPGRGPLKTDKVFLQALSPNGKDLEYPIDVLGSSYFTFKLGSDFAEGKYAFNIKRGTALKFINNVEYVLAKAEYEISAGTTIYGQVVCGEAGVPGVQVSDGYEVVLTDKDGFYQIKSKKKNSHVFITVPSGYEVERDGVRALFYKKLTSAPAAPERKDFTLYNVGDQTKHTILFFGDMHLANKQKDLSQFSRFTTDVNKYIEEHPGEKIYGFTLGDMTWDLYWYSSQFCFVQYLEYMNAIKNLPVYHTIGNHDHNMLTSINGNTDGWAAVDWDTAGQYRTDLGPNYYSVNIGQVHYIVTDNIYCTNTTGGASGDRHYNEAVSPDNIAWIREDLKNVDKDTPIIVTGHASIYSQVGTASLQNASELKSLFAGYTHVRFITGHTHKLWTIDDGNYHEHNNGAVCACWWWAGYYNTTLNLAQDGAPGGYRVMDVNGKDYESYFKGTGLDANVQFRTYDLNKVHMTADSWGITTYASQCESYLSKHGGYNKASSSNYVLINVWDYNPKWKIEVTENGKALSVSTSRIIAYYDPLFIAAYPMQRFKSSGSFSFDAFMSNHIFRVQASSATSTLEIKVTDDEGRVYTETMTRPKEFSIAAYK